MKFLLVGTHFAQGAPALVAKGLAQYATVTLIAEPENPYDANAVRVFVARDAVQEGAELDEALGGFGTSLGTMEWPFAIGHLGAGYGTKAAKAALREGHQFRLVADWHTLGGNVRTLGKLVQHPNGTCIIETGET